MRGIGRLIEGLKQGNSTAIAVLVFAVVGTVVIVVITEIIQRRRRASK
jgi:uncharacterized membrane protein YeaQ/YmgE (transglycosylase-associated protein family)